MKHMHKVISWAAVAAVVSGCATPQRPDPLEAMNRKVFAFNEAADQAVLAPVARGYVKTVPLPVRNGVRNFFANPQDIVSAASLLMQGRPKDALSDIARVAVNTTVGVIGVFDVSTSLGLPRHAEDIGQALGRLGSGPGAYVVWPLLGPSSVRDAVGLPLELALAPQTFVPDAALANSLRVLQIEQTRAELLSATRLLEEIALDRYLFVRDAYLQRRNHLVHDGAPPDTSD